jgi:hypothetical protein
VPPKFRKLRSIHNRLLSKRHEQRQPLKAARVAVTCGSRPPATDHVSASRNASTRESPRIPDVAMPTIRHKSHLPSACHPDSRRGSLIADQVATFRRKTRRQGGSAPDWTPQWIPVGGERRQRPGLNRGPTDYESVGRFGPRDWDHDNLEARRSRDSLAGGRRNGLSSAPPLAAALLSYNRGADGVRWRTDRAPSPTVPFLCSGNHHCPRVYIGHVLDSAARISHKPLNSLASRRGFEPLLPP